MSLGNVLILGDSYSTFKDYIPEGYAAYYGPELHPESSVFEVSDTWWHQLIEKTQSKLALNCSWSGTTICHTGYNKADCSGNSFAARLDKLIAEGFFNKNKIDTMIIFGGTNDSWAGSPVGELMYSDWQKDNLYSVLPAFCYILNRVKKDLQGVRVINVVNTELKPEITSGMLTACEKFGVLCVRPDTIEKVGGHPTAMGMTQICEKIIESL